MIRPEYGRAWNSTLRQRKTPMKRGGGLNRKPPAPGKPMFKPGKKTKLRHQANRINKKECERLGISRCEFKMPVCTGEPQGWSHSRKGRNMTTLEHYLEACLACNACHAVAELMKEEDMGNLIRSILAGREVASII